MENDSLAKLRQQLRSKLSELEPLLKAAFEREPVFPGTVRTSRHRCGKSWCHCAAGKDLHESVRLQIRFKDGPASRCLSEEEATFWKPRTAAYRRLRKGTQSFRKWHKGVLALLDAIERTRRSMDGLSEEDRKRPLR